MIKFLTLALLVVCAGTDEQVNEGGMQNGLLFFDESESLVDTNPNSYLDNLILETEHLLLYGKTLYPFFNFIQTLIDSLAAFAIAVSNAKNQMVKKEALVMIPKNLVVKKKSLVMIPKNPVVKKESLVMIPKNPVVEKESLVIIHNNPVVEKESLVMITKNPVVEKESLVIIPKNPVDKPNAKCKGQRTQIPSPNHCNTFLNCWDGWAYEQECPKGLLFSNKGYCDYAGNVDCHNRKLDLSRLHRKSRQPPIPQPPKHAPIPITIPPASSDPSVST